MLEGISVSLGCSRAGRAAMHPAAPFAGNRRRLTWAAGTRFGTATRTGPHRAGVAHMISHDEQSFGPNARAPASS